jgi:hypothetical protein
MGALRSVGEMNGPRTSRFHSKGFSEPSGKCRENQILIFALIYTG